VGGGGVWGGGAGMYAEAPECVNSDSDTQLAVKERGKGALENIFSRCVFGRDETLHKFLVDVIPCCVLNCQTLV